LLATVSLQKAGPQRKTDSLWTSGRKWIGRKKLGEILPLIAIGEASVKFGVH
jgi:hypothetical protein